jgi:hypothetical protein
LNAKGTTDPDGDNLSYNWWFYEEASSLKGKIDIESANAINASFRVPETINEDATIHIICEVKDNGSPQLTRYQRVVVKAKH